MAVVTLELRLLVRITVTVVPIEIIGIVVISVVASEAGEGDNPGARKGYRSDGPSMFWIFVGLRDQVTIMSMSFNR